ncbi:MAG: hypothetical protein HC828_05955 [Blastochloris sp.]|nr:hypothetical protein [Blastochloris sp.]
MMRQDDVWAVERRLDEIAAIRIAGYQRLARDKWLSPAAEVVDDIPAYATDEQAVYHLEDTVERTGRAAAYVVAQGWVADVGLLGAATETPTSGGA